jgi:hypothetical protein
MANKQTHTSAMYNYSAKQKNVQTSKYEKNESVLLLQFRQKWALSIPGQGPVLKQKAEETALKLHAEVTPSNGWHD